MISVAKTKTRHRIQFSFWLLPYVGRCRLRCMQIIFFLVCICANGATQNFHFAKQLMQICGKQKMKTMMTTCRRRRRRMKAAATISTPIIKSIEGRYQIGISILHTHMSWHSILVSLANQMGSSLESNEFIYVFHEKKISFFFLVFIYK